jgi:sugar lactone lactonase YvrE
VRRLATALLALLVAAVAYLLLWPVAIDPLPWTPPPVPALEGDLAPNRALAAATLLAEGRIDSPEDIAFDASGMLHTGTADGKIVRVDPDTGAFSVFGRVPGDERIGGLAFDAEGNLLACVVDVGLVSFSPQGRMEVLVGSVEGRPLHSPNELAIAPDGRVYFTELTWKKPRDEKVPEEFFEHRPRGSVFAYALRTGEIEHVQGDLYMANGLAVAPDARSLLVAENGTFSIRRIWIDGSGRPPEPFVESLPGIPDNIAFDEQGLLWVALPFRRHAGAEQLMPHPWAVKALFRLMAVLPSTIASPSGFVIALDARGRIVHNLQDPEGRTLSHVTSVVRHGEHLYFGSFHRQAIGRLPAP